VIFRQNDPAWQKKREHDEELKRRQEEEQAANEERKKEIEAMRQARHEERLREEAKRSKIHAEADYRTKEIDPFNVHDTAPARAQSDFRGGATDKQIRFLRRLGIGESTAMKWTLKQARAVIGDLASRTGGKFIIRFGKHEGNAINSLPVQTLKELGQKIHDADFQKNLQLYREEYREAHLKR